MLRLLTVVSALLGAYAFPRSEQHTDKFVPADGYPGETHHVTTRDGYILELHRIPHGRTPESPGARPVVFCMHGILGASNSFTHLGPETAIAYVLADAGYDVWMGNARGNRFSRKHISLSPDTNRARFFDFTFEEIALDDLPTMFDYILGLTNQEKLHYIGHSQGGTVFLILNSMTSDYHAKIASAHLLAGVGYQNSFPNTQLRLLAQTTDILYNSLRIAGNVEMFPPGSSSIFGRSSSTTSISRFLDIDASSDLIAGAAVKQIAHYGQNIRDRVFRRWNFGAVGNLSRYGRLTPPSYDLTNINIDVTLHYSLSDILLSERDTLDMANSMPNAKARKVARDSFSHLDYITSDDSKELVLNYIVNALKAAKK